MPLEHNLPTPSHHTNAHETCLPIMSNGPSDTCPASRCSRRPHPLACVGGQVDAEKPDWQEYTLRLGKKFKLEARAEPLPRPGWSNLLQ